MDVDLGKVRQERMAAVLLWVFSIVYLYASWQLKLGVPKKLGAGFIPLLIGVLLFVSASVYLYKALTAKRKFREGDSHDTLGDRGVEYDWPPVLGIAGCLIAYPFLLGRIHFILSTFAGTFAMLLFLRFKKPVHALWVAMVITITAYVVFSVILGVVLPNGPVEVFVLRLIRG
jgi:putative tricarboxylic transport membrane protein